MSTKIYTAYKVSVTRLNEFKRIVEDYQFDRIIERTKLLLDNINEEKFEKWVIEEFDGEIDFVNEEHKKYYKLSFIFDRFIEASHSSKCKPITDVDCGWSFFMDDGGYIYLRPYGEPWTYEGIDEVMPDWAEDYSYWNNTDKPNSIPESEWNKRGDKWYELKKEQGIVPMRIVIAEFTDAISSIRFKTEIQSELLESMS